MVEALKSVIFVGYNKKGQSLMYERNSVKIWCCIALVVLAMVYFLYEPTASSLYPKCIFLELTGYQCTGCGMQRAIHSLLHLRVAEAWDYNAYFVIVSPVLLLLFFSWLFQRPFPKLYACLTSQPFLWALGISAVLWWIGRNL